VSELARKTEKGDAKATTRVKLRDALGRILAGTAHRVTPGHRISVSSVAKEAGLSRTALYKLYPDIVSEVARAAQQNAAPKISRARRRELEVRRENGELHAKLALLLSQNATLLHRVAEAERRLAQSPLKSSVAQLKAAAHADEL
jgi:AcrR family transcriptional regulator